MDQSRLRDSLYPLIVGLKDAGTHDTLPAICESLGLPAPAAEGSKRDRMIAALEALADGNLPDVARRLLHLHPPPSSVRNEIQDLVWADANGPVIPKRFRRGALRTWMSTTCIWTPDALTLSWTLFGCSTTILVTCSAIRGGH